ncbi:MAG: thioredoxin family protein [Anaerolineae bacterium]
MIDRVLVLALAVGVVGGAYLLLRAWQFRRAVRLAEKDPVLAHVRPGVPVVVLFSSPHCAPCELQQKPALRLLRQELGDAIEIVEIDALEQPEAARRWGVFSVPTTIVLDASGRPVQINHGVTAAHKLKQQIQVA